jgi:FdrA protein
VRIVPTLKGAAEAALGKPLPAAHAAAAATRVKGKLIRGLFAGGTLCAEAQVVLRDAGLTVSSNAAIPGTHYLKPGATGHIILDLGDDEYTQGRPHPMIEPAVRDLPLAEALTDPSVGVVLIDIVLGTGASPDPAGHLAGRLAGRAKDGPPVVASVTGTDGDAQGRAGQIAKLVAAGVVVATSGADAAALALAAVQGKAAGG